MERIRGPKRKFQFTVKQEKLVNALAELPEEDWTKRTIKRIAYSLGYSKSASGTIMQRTEIFDAARYIQRGVEFEVLRWQWGGAGKGAKNANPDSYREAGEELWNPRMEAFCQEIVSDIEMNPRLASIRAGYSNGEYGWRLLQRKKIKDRITELREERRERFKAKADDVLQKLVQLANINMADYAKWSNGMMDLEDSDKITRSKLYGIKEVKQTIRGVGRNQTETLSIKLDDRQKPLALLARHLGLDNNTSSIDPQEFAAKLRQFQEEITNAVPGGDNGT